MPKDRIRINQRDLPDEVVSARTRFDLLACEVGPEIEPRLQRRRELQHQILEQLRVQHQLFVENTDLDPEEDTTPGAAWLMAGRCLSQADALLTLLEAGHGPAIVPTARSIHEASRLLAVLLDPEEHGLHQKWLDDEWVRPKAMSEAEQRHQTRLAEQMIRAGVRPPGRTHDLTKNVYGQLSAPAHHRRSSFTGEFNRTLRRYVYHPVDSPLRRAYWQVQADEILYDAYLSVGLMLTKCYGRAFWTSTVMPALGAMRELQTREPLLPDDLVDRAPLL